MTSSLWGHRFVAGGPVIAARLQLRFAEPGVDSGGGGGLEPGGAEPAAADRRALCRVPSGQPHGDPDAEGVPDLAAPGATQAEKQAATPATASVAAPAE